jgi:hypothetical protein
MEKGVFSGNYQGSPTIFGFVQAQGASGTTCPQSIVSNKGLVYYYATDGFYSFDGLQPNPIGTQQVDNWFLNDPDDGVDLTYLERIQGSADPAGKLIMWTYCGPQSGGTPNRLLIYNWSTATWSYARISVNWLAKAVSLGYSLDQLDAFTTPPNTGGLETLPFPFDSPVWQGKAAVLTAFDGDNNLAYFGGSNLAATLETPESQPINGQRCRVTNFTPLIDGGTPSIAIGYRERLEDTVAYGPAVTMNAYGDCPQRTDARYVRAQVTIPEGSTWTHAIGVDMRVNQSTRR